MKAIEAKLREAQEHEKQALERVTTLPPAKHMTTILAQKEVICGSGENEESVEDPSTIIGTTARRRSEDNRGVGHYAGKGKTCSI
jgi:hypothetical protein